MEASDAENVDSKIQIIQIDFAKLISNIESQCQKTLLTRKNQLLQKQQQKQNWLSKSKIIPPSFPKFASSEQYENTLKPSTFYENMFSDDGKIRIKNKPYRFEQSVQRNQCKTTYGNARKGVQCARTKSNWKLQFRKDQLNVLKYKYIRSQWEEGNMENTTKSFKVRKVFKKLQEGPPDVNFSKGIFIDTLDFKEQSRNRLKTSEVDGRLRQRFFIG